MPKWDYKFTKKSFKIFQRLPQVHQKRIFDAMDRVVRLKNPQEAGKPLQGEYKGLWRYRVGVYRIIVELHKNILVIEIIAVSHRQGAYKKNY